MEVGAMMHERREGMTMGSNARSWAVLVLLAGAVLGCAPQDRYAYEEIQREYADTLCAIAPAAVGPAKGEACVLNRPVTLADAVEIALENSPDKRIAVTRIRKAEAAAQAADAAFYPYVGVYTEYTAADAPSVYLFKTIDQRRLPADADFNDPGQLQNFESGIQARMNLYNGGRDFLNRRMAETGVDMARLDRQAVENVLVASVVRTFYSALAARAFIDIAEESVATVQKQLEVMRIRFEGGSALKSDILSLEVRLAKSREEVVRSRNRYKIALTALANIIGVAPEPEIRLAGEGMPSAAIPEDYPSGLAYGLAHRPELARARSAVVRSRMALDAARGGYLPTIDLNGRYYFDDENMAYDLDRENWVVAVMLNWDLFTGFTTRAAVDRAGADLQETFAEDRKIMLMVRKEVKSAYLDLEAARARLHVAERSVAMSEESLSLVRKQYDGGSANITRYLEAELDRNRAKIRAAAAFYDRETARAEVGRAIGYWARAGGTAPSE
jgi:outer membrane protein TolC